MGDPVTYEGEWKTVDADWTNNSDPSLADESFTFNEDSVPYSEVLIEDDQIECVSMVEIKQEDIGDYYMDQKVAETVTIQYENYIKDKVSETVAVKLEEKPIKRRRKASEGGSIKDETPEQRVARLAKMSAYAARRLANETPEQRARRLRRMSDYSARRLSSETPERRAYRLARMSAYAAKRMALETTEQRAARLARMNAYAQRKKLSRMALDPGDSLDIANEVIIYDNSSTQS